MHRAVTIIGVGTGVLVILLLLAVLAVYILSARHINRTYDLPAEEPLTIPTDSASLARGKHLASSVAICTHCHDEDFGGKLYADAGPIGLIMGPNLTSGRGGIGATYTDADWERAIRHGLRRDGTSLIVMPSDVFAHLTDEDVAAIIGYIKQMPPVDRELEPTHFRLLGRTLLVSGQLPLLSAPKAPRMEHAAAVRPETTAEYGRYLADIGGCHSCHGQGLSGGRVDGPPDLPPASNITPAGLSNWTEADFFRAMREGRRPDGSVLNPFMPWPVLGGMTDDELQALWLYLQSVPPREFGNK